MPALLTRMSTAGTASTRALTPAALEPARLVPARFLGKELLVMQVAIGAALDHEGLVRQAPRLCHRPRGQHRPHLQLAQCRQGLLVQRHAARGRLGIVVGRDRQPRAEGHLVGDQQVGLFGIDGAADRLPGRAARLQAVGPLHVEDPGCPCLHRCSLAWKGRRGWLSGCPARLKAFCSRARCEAPSRFPDGRKKFCIGRE